MTLTYTGRAVRLRETPTAQLVRSLRDDDRLPYKILARGSDRLLEQHRDKLTALTAWVARYRRG